MSIQYGILHNHSEFSIKDSAMNLETLFAQAKTLGAPAVALTDHGILTGFYDFMKLAKKNGIKPLPGIEAYYTPHPEDAEDKTRQHLILMAKDMEGYHAICDATYRSYSHLVKTSAGTFPCMTKEILTICFGPGSAGHGHVIATSACVGGVLAQLLLEHYNAAQSAKSLYKNRDKYHPIDNELLDAIQNEEDLESEVNALIARRDEYTADSKLSITGMKRALKALDRESEEYRRIETEIEAITKKKESAKAALESIKRDIANKKRAKTEFSKDISKMKASAERWSTINDQIDALFAGVKSKEEMYRDTTAAAQQFNAIFGQGNFFVELQYHRIGTEQTAMPLLAKIAKENGIPVVAANDAHYATNSREDVRARTLVAAMRFNAVINEEEENLSEGYGQLYLKTDEELIDILSEILDKDTVAQAMRNIGTIVDMCDVVLPTGETHYPVFKGGAPGESTSERLRRLAIEGIPNRYPGDAWTEEYADRLEYELNIINRMGFSDYLCIVQDFLDYGRSLATNCPEGVGYTIGPGRGSAVGSIVSYLIGITSVDPMKYGLLFERFLNPERVSMPDIDSDFHTEIRAEVIEYVKKKYGEKAVSNIITKGTMAGKSAIRGVGRVTNIPDSIVDTVARMIPSTPNAKIIDAPDLEDFCNANPVAKALVEDAKLVENTVVNYGMHAAGVIISDNDDVNKYVALMYNDAKEQWVAQCDMKQTEEAAGLLKMDFLGLRNLDIITDTMRRVKQNHGISIDIDNVPMEPEVFREIFAKGNTNSVFQFESSGMKGMLRSFRPDSMEDLILLVAAYRPGPMQSIPDIIDVKHKRATPTYIADGLEEILSVTYGSPIYQEQVMQIFNRIAGFSLGESDIIRRIMSKKKVEDLIDPENDYRGKFIRGLQANHAAIADAEAFWERLLDFAKYAFNKSHAAAYAKVAYQTAWLKYHFPAEYMCSVMTRTAYDKLPMLVAECQQTGLSIKTPDINRSANEFVNAGNDILYGFGNIKGVGNSGYDIIERRNLGGAYTSMKDFLTRTVSYADNPSGIDKTAIATLVKAGAFDGFCDGNRQSLLNGLEDLIDTVKKLNTQRTKVEERRLAFDSLNPDVTDEKVIKKAHSALKSAVNSLDRILTIFNEHTFLITPEDKKARLDIEYELLGAYITGNPIDEYAASIKLIPNVKHIGELEVDRNITICGIVSAARILQRKKDGVPFGIMTVFDGTGEIEVKVFSSVFAEFGDLVEVGSALEIHGDAKLETAYNPEDGDVLFFSATKLKKLMLFRHERFIMTAPTVADWQEHYSEIIKFKQDDGYALYFHDSSEGVMRACAFRVAKNITTLSIPGMSIAQIK